MHKATKVGLALIASTAATLMTVGTATAGSNTTAVPAGTAGFAPAGCMAQFVRSASGIINETNRTGCPTVGGVAAGTALTVQFRPTLGKVPNPACESDVVLTPFSFSTTEASLSTWFDPNQVYNVCFYLANNQVASSSLNSAVPDVTNVAVPLAGRYRITVSGTWDNAPHGLVDAEYNNGDHGLDWTDASFTQDGFPAFGLGGAWGDVIVNGTDADWGPYNPTHTYSTEVVGSSIGLNIFDGTPVVAPFLGDGSWYGDNTGSLNYTVTYLGLV